MLQSTDPERLSNREGSKAHPYISLKRENIKDCEGGLGVDRDGNKGNRRRLQERGLRETASIERHLEVRHKLSTMETPWNL